LFADLLGGLVPDQRAHFASRLSIFVRTRPTSS
jgi:hypothetical protein